MAAEKALEAATRTLTVATKVHTAATAALQQAIADQDTAAARAHAPVTLAGIRARIAAALRLDAAHAELAAADEAPPDDDTSKDDVDLSGLSDAEIQELADALDTVRRLTGRGLAPIPAVQFYLPHNGRDMPAGPVLYTDPDRMLTVRHIIVDPKRPASEASDEELLAVLGGEPADALKSAAR
jgi:hypothetical protein